MHFQVTLLIKRMRLLLFIGISLCLILVKGEVLSNYKHLRCSVCELLSQEFERRIDEVNKKTFQTTHRLSKENKISRNTMKGSELAAIEVLDGICQSLGNCTLKYSHIHGHRIFSNNQDLPKGQFYSSKDRQYIGGLWENGCRVICDEIIEQFEDELIDYIRGESRTATNLCNSTLSMCNRSDILDHIGIERLRQKKQFDKSFRDEF